MRKKKHAPPRRAATTTVSTLSLLQQILEQAKLSNIVLLRIEDELNENTAIALASKHYLKDIETELSAQGEELEEQGKILLEILEAIQGPFQATTGSTLTQTSGEIMPGPYSILAGTSATFLRSNLPAESGGLASDTVPTYTPSNSAVTISPDPNDPTNTDAISVAVPASDTETSFDIDVTITPAADATGAPGTPVTDSFTIMVVAAPPPFVPTTNSDLTQTGGNPARAPKTKRRR